MAAEENGPISESPWWLFFADLRAEPLLYPAALPILWNDLLFSAIDATPLLVIFLFQSISRRTFINIGDEYAQSFGIFFFDSLLIKDPIIGR